MIFFEKLFYQIDSDSSGYILFSEMERIMSFLSLNTTMQERYEVLRAVEDEGEGHIEQDEFLQACLLLLWHVYAAPSPDVLATALADCARGSRQAARTAAMGRQQLH